jgi:hypothetical protein
MAPEGREAGIEIKMRVDVGKETMEESTEKSKVSLSFRIHV